MYTAPSVRGQSAYHVFKSDVNVVPSYTGRGGRQIGTAQTWRAGDREFGYQSRTG